MPMLRLCSAAIVVWTLVSVVEDVSASMMVRHMNLQQMCDAAGRIFRGTVLGVSEGSVSAGGGQLPTLVYRVRVDEHFKGSYEVVKDQRIVTLQMVTNPKRPQQSNLRHLLSLDAMPSFQVGHDYLILATSPSAAGLSTPVGLNQGVFKLAGKAGQETAVNGNDNIGLEPATAARGPMPYASLRSSILRHLGRTR